MTPAQLAALLSGVTSEMGTRSTPTVRYEASATVTACMEALEPARLSLHQLQMAHGLEIPLAVDLRLAGMLNHRLRTTTPPIPTPRVAYLILLGLAHKPAQMHPHLKAAILRHQAVVINGSCHSEMRHWCQCQPACRMMKFFFHSICYCRIFEDNQNEVCQSSWLLMLRLIAHPACLRSPMSSSAVSNCPSTTKKVMHCMYVNCLVKLRGLWARGAF